MTERLLFWIGIIVLLVATYAVEEKVDTLETQLSQIGQQQSVNGGTEE